MINLLEVGRATLDHGADLPDGEGASAFPWLGND